jgi:hypothetical protein
VVHNAERNPDRPVCCAKTGSRSLSWGLALARLLCGIR